MWARLVGLTRAVLVVAWTVLVVGFGPSTAWAGGDNSSSTSPPAPTGSPSSPSSSAPPSSEESPDTSSSTSAPEDSSSPEPSEDEPLVVVLDEDQLGIILDELADRQPEPLTVEPLAQTSGTLSLEQDQWDLLTSHLLALVLAAALAVAVLFAGTLAGWGRRHD